MTEKILVILKSADFIHSCYNPETSGFIGQPYSPSLLPNFRISTMDNTYYAIIALDILGDDWSAYSSQKTELITYIKGLQSEHPWEWYFGGFHNDNDTQFGSLQMFEPNLLSCYYGIKSLEYFGQQDSIAQSDFHQYLNGIYHEQRNYFDMSYFNPPTNNSNIIATALGLQLTDLANNFYINLGAKGHVLIQHIFEVKVHDLRIKNIQDQDIGLYDSTDSRYCLYYGHDSYHPDLIALSNDIVNEKDNPIEKAEAIYNWIDKNIEYDDKDKWYGALETYYSKKGVCLDFSELMIALLRIQKIPARMIHGYLLDSDELRKGETFEYEDRFSTHAWVQYYVPRIGWIACDPVNDEFGLNGIHCGYIATSLGRIDPDSIPRIWIRPTELVYDELNHTLVLSVRGSVHSSWDLKITILESDYSDAPSNPVYYIIYAALIIILCVQFGIIILIFREAYCQIIALKKIKSKKVDKIF